MKMIKKIFLFLFALSLISFCIFMVYKIINRDTKLITNNDTKKEVKVVKKEKKGNVPVIKLKGQESMKIVKNGVYEEMGATALDEEDKDISTKIKIVNNIKIDTPGDYTVDYTVTDSDNNEVTLKRKVKVFEVTNKDTNGISVFMYHYFYDDTTETGEDNNYISKSHFEEQLKYLSENDYYFPNMKEIRKYVDGKLDLPEKSVVLTMDDGHADNYSIAYPLAVKYKVPIVMFVVTSWTDVSMDLQQEMTNTGYVIFQSHTHDMHKAGCSGMGHGGYFQCVSYEEGLNDLLKSKEALNNSDSLAYPFGDYSDNTIKIMKDAGFSLGFTTQNGQIHINDNPYTLSRMRINGDISLDTFVSQL